jgi:peptide/nickel transport system substrate-binding protein
MDKDRQHEDDRATSVDELFDGFREGMVSRRGFIQRSLVMGASLAAVQGYLADNARAGIRTIAAATPRRGGTLTAVFSADPAGLDPVRGPSGMSHVVIEQVYSTLMSLTPDNELYPDLAQSYTVSKDGLTYVFKLRKGVKFHNGDPLTAEDVQFTFDRLRAKGSGYAYGSQIATIKRVEVVDPHTVVFHLSEKTAPFLIYMAFPGSSIVPKKLVKSGYNLNKHPIGSGAFKFVSYEPKHSISFVRNPNYYQPGKPYLDAMTWRIVSDTSALTTALLTGEADFTNVVPPQSWKQVKSKAGIVTETVVGSSYNWLLANNTKSPLANAKVRQAISYALNRDDLVNGAFFGLATPILGGVVPNWSWGYAPDVKFTGAKGDPAKAKALLAQAGYPKGFSTDMKIASSFPNLMAMAPIIQQDLAKVGIKTKIGAVEIPRYWDEVWSTSNFDITTMYWVSPLVDPDDFLYNNYHSKMAINVQKYSNPKMDRLLDTAKSTPNQARRKQLYREIQQLSMQDMPIVPLVNGWLLWAYTEKLRGFNPTRTGLVKNLRDAWLAG